MQSVTIVPHGVWLLHVTSLMYYIAFPEEVCKAEAKHIITRTNGMADGGRQARVHHIESDRVTALVIGCPWKCRAITEVECRHGHAQGLRYARRCQLHAWSLS